MAQKNGGSEEPARATARRSQKPKVRYAVVGLGHIAQAAVLPAFENAGKNSQLAALVSDDPVKLAELSKRYGVANTYSYDDYSACLESGEIDAVYIALPNHLHRDYAVRAAHAGVHVLCEKPMALSQVDAKEMIEAAQEHDVRLMIAYRLHLQKANLAAIEIVQSGKIGVPRYFASTFSMQVEEGDIRLQKKTGGGTLWDIGVYCINAARYLFQDEPVEVFAFMANNGEKRFAEVDEMMGAVLRFPEERTATFVTSFGAADRADYEIVGTKGSLRVENAYEYAMPMRHVLKLGDKTQQRTFAKTDQFAAELVYFSDCVRKKREPEPGGLEGMIDVALVEALYRSAEIGKPVPFHGPERERRPTAAQEIERPASEEPELVHTSSPTREDRTRGGS